MYSRSCYLIQFAHKHVDFHRAELCSVLDMHDFELIFLEKSESTHQRKSDDKRIVYEEQLPNQKISFGKKLVRSFMIVSFHRSVTDDVISKCLKRCILIKSVMELWGSSDKDITSCASEVRKLCNESHHKHFLITNYCKNENRSWKISIQTFGSKYTREDQQLMRSHFSFLPFSGPVKMSNPCDEFLLIREVEVDELGSAMFPRYDHNGELIVENDKRAPLAIYFGRAILGGIKSLNYGRVEQYSLKSRRYLGPTSMDTELSMVMTNLGQVREHTFAFDPFVGTGSILVCCAILGAYCFGTDIDIRVLRGRSMVENIFSNFDQYDLQRPEIVRSDNSLYHRHYRAECPIYDVIICDPPYGIRAGARKCGSKRDEIRVVPEQYRYDHVAQTKPYEVSDVMADMLDVAARTLVLNGRLVYIIPSMHDFDQSVDLPRHPCLKLLHICYQPLSSEYGRRVITMKKVNEYIYSQRNRYISVCWVNGPESANKCANIREKLLDLAKAKPGYEEKAALRKKKRKAKKDEEKKKKFTAIEDVNIHNKA